MVTPLKVSEWCDLWGMIINASKTKTVIVYRSRTIHPKSPPLTIDGTVLKESDNLDILGVAFDYFIQDDFSKASPLGFESGSNPFCLLLFSPFSTFCL